MKESNIPVSLTNKLNLAYHKHGANQFTTDIVLENWFKNLHKKVMADLWDIQFGIANLEGEKSPTYALINDIRNRIKKHLDFPEKKTKPNKEAQ